MSNKYLRFYLAMAAQEDSLLISITAVAGSVPVSSPSQAPAPNLPEPHKHTSTRGVYCPPPGPCRGDVVPLLNAASQTATAWRFSAHQTRMASPTGHCASLIVLLRQDSSNSNAARVCRQHSVSTRVERAQYRWREPASARRSSPAPLAFTRTAPSGCPAPSAAS